MPKYFPPMYEQLLAIQKNIVVQRVTVVDAYAARLNFLYKVLGSNPGMLLRDIARRLAVTNDTAESLLRDLRRQGRAHERNKQWFPDSPQ